MLGLTSERSVPYVVCYAKAGIGWMARRRGNKNECRMAELGVERRGVGWAMHVGRCKNRKNRRFPNPTRGLWRRRR